MKVTNLNDFFNRISYSWQADLEKLKIINHFTKTRTDPNKQEGFMSYGGEQSFLVKSIAAHMGAKSFFEIGTGRGTACYSVALEEAVEEVVTVDIVSHYQEKKEAIGYKEAIVSNNDLYQMIPYEEKEKITFMHRSELLFQLGDRKGEFDLAFIDGDHTNERIIHEDFKMCNSLLRPGGIILFDDYHPTKFAVKRVADKILAENPTLTAELVCFHGHLFEQETKGRATETGILVVKK